MARIARLPGAAVAVACISLLAPAGCTHSARLSAIRGADIKPLTEVRLPDQLMGLAVTPEDVKGAVDAARRSQVEALAVYSLRSDDLLQATLQVSRLRDEPRLRQQAFRARVVSQIGSSLAHRAVLDTTPVYLTTGTKQRVSVWFRGRYFFVLAVRDDYRHPRSLLRTALGITA